MEIEKIIISMILNEDFKAKSILAEVSEDEFKNEWHKQIFKVAKKQHPLSMENLFQELGNHPEKMNIIGYCMDIMNEFDAKKCHESYENKENSPFYKYFNKEK